MKSTVMVQNGLVLLQIVVGVVKVEPGSCSESCVTPDGDEIEVLDMRLEGGPGVEEEVNPVAITFKTIKFEYEVSLYMSIINTFSPGGVVLLRGLSCPLSG
jgi:hypothetical protein